MDGIYHLVNCYITMGNGHRNSGVFHWTWWFSIAMSNYQRVMIALILVDVLDFGWMYPLAISHNYGKIHQS